MKYRHIEYTVVQGLGRQVWKWGFELETKVGRDQSEAVAKAERAIDLALALAPKKLRLVPPREH